jgi:hypothetical protein
MAEVCFLLFQPHRYGIQLTLHSCLKRHPLPASVLQPVLRSRILSFQQQLAQYQGLLCSRKLPPRRDRKHQYPERIRKQHRLRCDRFRSHRHHQPTHRPEFPRLKKYPQLDHQLRLPYRAHHNLPNLPRQPRLLGQLSRSPEKRLGCNYNCESSISRLQSRRHRPFSRRCTSLSRRRRPTQPRHNRRSIHLRRPENRSREHFSIPNQHHHGRDIPRHPQERPNPKTAPSTSRLPPHFARVLRHKRH